MCGLPSDTKVNQKNSAHIMEIITSSGRNIGNEVVNFVEGLNKRWFDEQVSDKRRKLDKSNKDITILKEQSVEKPRVVEGKVEVKEIPYAVDGDVSKL